MTEQPVWFGPADRLLCGWLTAPTSGIASQGVLLAPPIGREARGGRQALRLAARRLARRDIVSLRFDYDGTGDSSGMLDDPDRDGAWTESVSHAAALLRAVGVASISAVGMRLGATILGAAADKYDLGLSSLVLWDPCASGRNYLRELSALESLRREDVSSEPDGSIETSEFVFTPQTASEIRRLNLTTIERSPVADRLLVVTRDDRSIPDKLQERLSKEKVDWSLTSEQHTLIGVDPLHASLPEKAVDEIVEWLHALDAPTAPIQLPTERLKVSIPGPVGAAPISERFVEIGSRRLFGIVTEAAGDLAGPVVIFLNVSTDEHTGPSRLWVELSRRWAALGLQCVRFDLTGIGDSPMLPGERTAHIYDQNWLDDLREVARALRPDRPSDSVYIGLCSGAFLAVEGGLSVHAKGVCVINPPVGIDFLHGSYRLAGSRRAPVRALGTLFKDVALRLRWVSVVIWQGCRVIMPTVFSTDVMSRLAGTGTDLLVLSCTDELSPYPKTNRFDRFFSKRLIAPKGYDVTFVPGLDHSMLAAKGRARTVDLLDRHVRDHYVVSGAADESDHRAEGKERT
ncbi:MAG TPA: alpha/beta hydrolase family protein [Acidimicrobiales bacterium]|nr:alpha/beta hydrolase family protein [Acidimicrobiales bacterium]